MSADPERDLALIEAIELIEAEERDRCATHPAYLIDRMFAVDEREAEENLDASTFHFDVLTPAERAEANQTLIAFFGDDEAGWPEHLGWRAKPGDWFWQREVLDWWLENRRTISLKARQLGITWNGCGFTGWTALYKPGSTCLHFRQTQDDAFENVKFTWELLASLPKHLWNGAEIEKPSRATDPFDTEELRLRFPDGRSSRIVGQSSGKDRGHGKRAAVILLDEFSRIENAGSIMKAVNSAAGRVGKVLIISTANGRANEETGDGNRFHYMWINHERIGYAKKFLPWSLHPLRDQDWYDNDTEVKSLLPHERAEQYPANEHEAFALTNKVYYDPEDLQWYADNAVKHPLYRMDFADPKDENKFARGASARIRKHDRGLIRIYREPEDGHRYAIGADVATPTGKDYSAAYVIDLSDCGICAEFHGRLAEDLYAAQLHYLGRWYGRVGRGHSPSDPESTGFAKLAVEVAGGYGNAVITPLRDRVHGRPAYGNLYRNVLDNRPDKPTAKPWGYPMNRSTRQKAVANFGQLLRERAIPYLPNDLLLELGNFVHRDHGTTPAAIDGTNDDRVMSALISYEMHHLYGEHAAKPKPKAKRGHTIGLGRRS